MTRRALPRLRPTATTPTFSSTPMILSCGHHSDGDTCEHPDCAGDSPDPWDLCLAGDSYEADLDEARRDSHRRMTAKIWNDRG